MLHQDGPAIIYRERSLSLPLRLVVGFLGLSLAGVIPLPFLLHANWGRVTPGLLLAACAILSALSLGGFFVAQALASRTELRLDPDSGLATVQRRGPVVNWRKTVPLSALCVPELVMRQSDAGSFAILRLQLPDGRPVDMAGFRQPADAALWRARIAELVPCADGWGVG